MCSIFPPWPLPAPRPLAPARGPRWPPRRTAAASAVGRRPSAIGRPPSAIRPRSPVCPTLYVPPLEGKMRPEAGAIPLFQAALCPPARGLLITHHSSLITHHSSLITH